MLKKDIIAEIEGIRNWSPDCPFKKELIKRIRHFHN